MSHTTSGIYSIFEKSSMYDLFQNAVGRKKVYKYLISEFFQPKAETKMLDIGCGTGDILDFLPENIVYTGFDLNPDYINTAKTRFGTRGNFVCKRAGEFELDETKKETFDIIITLGVLHHLTDTEIEEIFKTTNRYLKKGGFFFCFEPVYHPGQSFLSRFILSKDRGGNIKSDQGWQDLFNNSGLFSKTEFSLKTDLINIPYSHYLIKAYK